MRIDDLENLAKKIAWSDEDDLCLLDYTPDDAFEMGVKDGKILLARELLRAIRKRSRE